MSTKAIVLLSGGLDSATVLAIANAQQYACYTLSFDYGQRHQFELNAARKIAAQFNVVQHLTLKVDLRKIGGSALTADIPVPKGEGAPDAGGSIPVTYVPARNTIFLSLALGWAEALGAFDIFIGVNALDYSGYPDCRPEFINAFERMANVATKAGLAHSRFKIHAPLIRMSKAEIIQKGVELGVDYRLTQSCYDPPSEGIACGFCDSCQLRKRGFRQAGIPDPTIYQSPEEIDHAG
ncbi:7-cyano-7-deazaguanine synthase QueC [candidate division KSB1 bacterium]|nr:7-cyano-7-deazaguanine synthase QueC [candidate division KSB1 bacterium]